MSTFKGYRVTAPDGKTYEVTAPEGTPEEELYSYVEETYYPTTAVAGETNKSAPLIGNSEKNVRSRSMEEVPGARDFLNEAFFDDADYNTVAELFAEKAQPGGPFEGVSLPADGAKLWAMNKAFAQTPTGREWFKTNSPIDPVNRSTGEADPEAPDSMLEEFGVAAKKSATNMANSAIGAAALGAELVGAEETSDALLDTYLENAASIEFNNPTAAKKFKDVRTLGDAGMLAANILGELAPNIASAGGIGLIGSKAGAAIGQRSVSGMVDDLVSKGVTQEVAEQMALKAVQKKAYQGAVAATTAQSMGIETGSIYGDTYGETGEKKLWASLLAGTAAGSLDALLPAFVFKKIGVGQGIAETAIVQSLVKKVGKDAAAAFLLEGGTEALQTIIEQLPAGKSINWEQVVEAGLRGGFGGSVVGGTAGAYQGVQQNNRVNTINPPKSFEGDPIAVPTTKGKKDGPTYKAQISKTQDDVIARVAQLTEKWENGPAFEVYQNFEDLDGVPNGAIGVERDGKIFLNTENIVATAKKRGVAADDIVSAVTYHEALGHYGMSQLFGDELDAQLANIIGNSTIYKKRVEKWLKDNPNAYKNDPNRDIRALDEILAERSEKGQLPATIVNQFKNKIKDLGRKMGLDLQYSTREVETILGMAHSAVTKGMGRDVRGNGYRMMYAGENAAAPPRTAFGLRDEKRWFSGPDGKARFEFSDEDATLNESKLSIIRETYLPDVLGHSELFKQYPSLKDTRVRQVNMGYGEQGSYNARTNVINVAEANKDKLSTILHEIQHNIQEIEGFAKGGNSMMAVKAMSDDHVLDTAKNVLAYKQKKLDALAVEVGALRVALEMPEGKRLMALGNERNEIYAEMDAREKELKKGKKDNFSREQLLDDFEYFRLSEELDAQWDSFNAARNALKKKLFPDGYDRAPKQDRLEFQELTWALEGGEKKIESKEQKLYTAEQEIGYLKKDIESQDYSMLRAQLNNDDEVPFQAYESLLGEVEARDTQARQKMTLQERMATPAYTSQNELVPPENYVITGVQQPSEESMSVDKDFAPRLRDMRTGNDMMDNMTEIERERRGLSPQERMADIHQRELDSYKPPADNDRYMMMTDPDRVEFTQEEIDEFTPEELFDSENALKILDGMTKGYTPVVMSYDDLKREAEDRGLSPSKVLRNKGIGAGEIVKRLYMYDIAMTKMNDRLSTLWEKIQSGKFTADDKAAYLRGVYKRDELAGRIFEDQGEIGRALAALKSIQYTRRRVKGMQETLVQITSGSPYEALNDPEAFYRFASQIQGQIDESRQKAKEAGKQFIGNALNLPRALMSSMDLSAPLRQGIFLIHKAAWWKSFFQMFRYAGDQKAFDDLMESITERDSYGDMVKAKLALSNLGSNLNAREEDFMSQWAEKLPVVGRFVKGSERAYVGFLNKLRADVFDQLVSKLPADRTEQDLKDVAGFVNAASGRGELFDFMKSSAPFLNAAFFSPRLMSSRFKMTTALIDPRTYVGMNKTARNEYIKSILTVGGLALLINALASAGGAETEEDPRSSDFGKLKFGNTRYDILGGEGQYITLLARLTTNAYKTADGEVKKYGNKVGQTNQLDAINKFFSNKAAPIPSFVMDYFRGVDAVGKKFETDEAIMSRFMPMYMADIQENIEEEGLPKGIARSAPGLFGIGTQTYKPASLETEEPLEAPDDFKMVDAVDGEYANALVKDGIVTLDDEAKKEWASRINFYYKEWMKDEVARPDWKKLPEKEKKAIIKEVRADARKEAKADMLELLEIEEEE